MKPEAQRIAIAEACGWKRLDSPHYNHLWTKPGTTAPDYPVSGQNKNVGYPPDFLTDLNAMHEAEKVLTHDQLLRYWGNLINICGERYRPLLATASERAEAFLRTIGKWEDV